MKYVIKTLVLLGLFICSIIILEQHHLESFVNTYTASEVKQVGNTFSNNTKTKYTYQTSKGDKYVIYLSKKGKAYIVRTSKSGKQYKQYLPEVTKKLGNDSHLTVIYLPQTQRLLNTSSAQKQHYNPATPKNSCSVRLREREGKVMPLLIRIILRISLRLFLYAKVNILPFNKIDEMFNYKR